MTRHLLQPGTSRKFDVAGPFVGHRQQIGVGRQAGRVEVRYSVLDRADPETSALRQWIAISVV